jgi:hypothetical protein
MAIAIHLQARSGCSGFGAVVVMMVPMLLQQGYCHELLLLLLLLRSRKI